MRQICVRPPQALRGKVGQFRTEVQHKARQMIHETMPKKVLQVNELFMSLPPALPTSYDPLVAADEATTEKNGDELSGKKRKLGDASTAPHVVGENGRIVYPQHIASRKEMVQLAETIRTEVLQMIEVCNTVKISIQLHIPKIESGGDFGVQIQEETVQEISRGEDSGFSMLETITKYHTMRAKLVTKVLKYPNVEDYSHSVRALDYKEYLNLRMCIADLRNVYATMYDLIVKNLDRLKKPRSSHSASMF